MKNLKYIIATLFVVAVGAGIFFACQKEEIKDENITSSTQKIQKDGDVDNTFFFYESDPGVYYWVYEDSIAFSLANTIYLEDGNQHGIVSKVNGKFSSFICINGGTNCGIANEVNDNNEIIRTGFWCQDEQLIYVCMQ